MASIQTPVLTSAALRDEYANHLSVVLAEIEHDADEVEADFATVASIAEATEFDSAYVRELVASLRSGNLVEDATADDDELTYTGPAETLWDRMAEITAWLTAPETRSPAADTATPGKQKAAGNSCYCGCSATTASAKSLYRPGHDARHAGEVARRVIAAEGDAEEQGILLATLPTDKLRNKARGIADATSRRAAAASKRIAAAAAKREETAARKAEAREAKAAKEAAAKEEPTYTMGEVKTGRWVYAARRSDQTGVVERNENRQGTGEWKASSPEEAKKFKPTAA